MTQPTPWAPSLVYVTYAAAHPTAPFPPASLDTDFANLKVTLGGILGNLALLQRDDGALVNGIVTVNSLGQDTKNLIGGWNPRGTWTTATNYAVKDMVTPAGGVLTYVCAIAHTSGATFAGDLALGRWQVVNSDGSNASVIPANVTFSQSDVLLGRQTAGGGAGEEIPLTSTGRSIIGAASVGAVNTALGLGTGNSPTFTGLTLSGLTSGAVALVGASGVLTNVAAGLAYDATTGGAGGFRLGINTSAPAVELDVRSGIGAVQASLTSLTTNLSKLNLGNASSVFSITQYQTGEKGAVFADSVGGTAAWMSASGITLPNTKALLWDNGSGGGPTGAFMRLSFGSDGGLFISSGTNARYLRVCSTYTTDINFESVGFNWSGGAGLVGTNKGSGGGLARELHVMAGGTDYWTLQTDGMLRPTTAQANLLDIGTTGVRVRTLYVGTSIVLPTGTILGQATTRISSAQLLTTQATLQNATGLSFAIGANEEWVGSFDLQFTNSLSTTGLKVAVTTPVGATQTLGSSLIPQNYGAANVGYLNTTVSGTAMDFTAAGQVGVNGAAVIVRCWIKNGATPGTVQLQFAQSTSSGTGLSLDAGSFMRFIRVI